MKLNKNKIRIIYYVFTIFLVAFLITSLNLMYLNALENQLNGQVELLSDSTLNLKKIYVQDIVDTTIHEIKLEEDLIIKKETESIKSISDILIRNIELEYGDNLANHKIVNELIKSHVVLVVYSKTTNSIIYDLNINLSDSTIENSQDLNLLFSEYPIKHFQETSEYIVASGVSEDYLMITVQNNMENKIRNKRFADNGYVWINKIVNYEGGDDYAIRQVHPNLPETEGNFLSTNTEDIEGNKPYKLELEGINKTGELYNEYFFKKMDEESIAHKLSYSKLYKPFDWVIATGVYLDDVDKLILFETETTLTLYSDIKKRALFLTFIMIIISIAFIYIFEKRILSIIAAYEMVVNQKNIELEVEKSNIERIAYTDYLTGLINRRPMITQIEASISSAQRYNSSFTVGIIDIDNFKIVNDTYGHSAGDAVLIGITEIMTSNTRTNDAVARWGGEEFVILLSQTSKEDAISKFNDLREIINSTIYQYEDQQINCSVSIGTIFYTREHIACDDLIKFADQNLYEAKRTGKNKVVSS